jgi:hypothetical protein
VARLASVSGGPNHRVGQAIVALVVVTVCLTSLDRVLPHLLPSVVVVAVAAMVVRLVFARTRGW